MRSHAASCAVFAVRRGAFEFTACLRTALEQPAAGAAESARITAMTVSPNRRLLAVAERGERPTVTVYDLTTMKKRKVLSHTEAGTKASRTVP